MMRILISICLLFTPLLIQAQSDLVIPNANHQLELNVDSLERRIDVNHFKKDTSYYLHYQVRNTSNDSLVFKSNTCFYYNQTVLEVGGITYDLNPRGGCYFNSYHVYPLAPDESFSEAMWITGNGLQTIPEGIHDAKLTLTLVKDENTIFRIDGRGIEENTYNLIFSGNIVVTVSEIMKAKKVHKADRKRLK